MALDSGKTHVSGQAFVFGGDVGLATEPANPFVNPPAATLPNLGHTSYDDGFKITPNISVDVKKTHQAPGGVRSIITDYSVTLDFTLEQVDPVTLALFFGAVANSDGSFWIPKFPVPLEKSLYIRSIDGGYTLPVWIPRASIISNGDLVFKPGDFSPLPVEAKILDLASAPGLARILGTNVTTLAVAPTTQTLSLSGTSTAALVATATFSDSSTAGVTPYCSWTSSNPAKVTVSSTGVITAVAIGGGTTTITGSYGGQTATCAVTVTA